MSHTLYQSTHREQARLLGFVGPVSLCRPSSSVSSSSAASCSLPSAYTSSSSSFLSRRAVAVTVSRRSVITKRLHPHQIRSSADADSSSPSPSEDGAEQPVDQQGQTSASEILKTLREDSAADMANKEDEDDRASRSMLGVYRDVDGKSNVWAVEPLEETDTRPQLSKTVIILVAAGFIIAALLILPILPFTNPDQA